MRSSIARRLGMDIAGAVPADRNVEGVVEMMLEAKLAEVFRKARFWEKNAGKQLNDRQRLMLNKLIDGFEGN